MQAAADQVANLAALHRDGSGLVNAVVIMAAAEHVCIRADLNATAFPCNQGTLFSIGPLHDGDGRAVGKNDFLVAFGFGNRDFLGRAGIEIGPLIRKRRHAAHGHQQSRTGDKRQYFLHPVFFPSLAFSKAAPLLPLNMCLQSRAILATAPHPMDGGRCQKVL